MVSGTASLAGWLRSPSPVLIPNSALTRNLIYQIMATNHVLFTDLHVVKKTYPIWAKNNAQGRIEL